MTQDNGHTAGPWFEDEAGICAAGRLVAIVAVPDECAGADPDSLHDTVRAELSANARLIAAAPVLLEALDSLVAPDLIYEGYGPEKGGAIVIRTASHAEAMARVEKARAALLQAKGEAE